MLKFAILAALIQLAPGYNNVGQSGEVVAVQAATSNATATVSVKAVESLTTYTNVTQEVVTYEPAWRVTVTNFDPFVGFVLPDLNFPITGEYNGEPAQVTSASGIRFKSEASGVAMIDKSNDVYVAYFSTDPPYTYQFISDWTSIQFNGERPIENTSPRLEYVNNPASYVTNVVGYLDYDDFKWTNGVSTIVGEPVRFDMAITNTVVVQRVPAQTYAKTNTLATVTTSGHFGSTVTNGFLFGGGILVEGAAEGDTIKLILK